MTEALLDLNACGQRTSNGPKRLAFTTLVLPFELQIPSISVPPAFESTHAQVRHLLSATLALRSDDGLYQVRTTVDTQLISRGQLAVFHQPESSAAVKITAETSPLDEQGKLMMTASLPRKHWSSGYHIPLTVRIANWSPETVVRIALALCRTVTYVNSSASRARCDTKIETKHWPQRSARLELQSGHTKSFRFTINSPLRESTIHNTTTFKVDYAIEVTIRTVQGTRLALDLPLHLLSITGEANLHATTFAGQVNPPKDSIEHRRRVCTDTSPQTHPLRRNQSSSSLQASLSKGLTTPKLHRRVLPFKSGGKPALTISAPVQHEHDGVLHSLALQQQPVLRHDLQDLSLPERPMHFTLSPLALGLEHTDRSIKEGQAPESVRRPQARHRLHLPPMRAQSSWDCLKEHTKALYKQFDKSNSRPNEKHSNWI